MRSIVAILFLSAIICGCKRDFHCVCHVDGQESGTHTYHETKRDAQEHCNTTGANLRQAYAPFKEAGCSLKE
jgi:hypothetical protein